MYYSSFLMIGVRKTTCVHGDTQLLSFTQMLSYTCVSLS